jgi:hypothetical protein
VRADVQHKFISPPKTSCSNDRPHPGPLLQGEGESFAASLKFRRSRMNLLLRLRFSNHFSYSNFSCFGAMMQTILIKKRAGTNFFVPAWYP